MTVRAGRRNGLASPVFPNEMADSSATPPLSDAARVPPVRHQRVEASSATRALNVVGDRWTLMILHLAFFRVRRFDDFQARIGIARSLLVDRLRRLEAAEVFKRVRYQERPARDDYRLTGKGLDLYSVALTLVGWEKRWHYDPANPSHRLHHTCGKEFTPELRCGACGERVGPRDLEARPGPGAAYEPSGPPRAQRRSTVATSDAAPGDPSLDRSLEVLGDRWTSHLIAAAFLGRRRFTEFQEALGVAPNILTDRLNRLIALGILKRHLYQERPERWEYRLTSEGRALFPLLIELVRWGDRWLATEAGPPLLITHAKCGHALVPVVACDQCHKPATYRTVSPPPAGIEVKAAG